MEGSLGDTVGVDRLVDLKKMLDEVLDEHVVLTKITLEVDHLVQDFLVIGLYSA